MAPLSRRERTTKDSVESDGDVGQFIANQLSGMTSVDRTNRRAVHIVYMPIELAAAFLDAIARHNCSAIS